MKLFGNTSGGKHGVPSKSIKSSKTPEKNRVFDESVEQVPREITKRTPVKAAKQNAVSKKTVETQKNVKKPGSKFGRNLLITLCVIVAVSLCLVIGYSLWEKPPEIVVDDIPPQTTPDVGIQEPDEGDDQDNHETPDDTDDTQNQQQSFASVRKEDCYTFLVAASDAVGANTDVIMVGRFDIKEGTLSVVSIPRDTLVNVSWGVKKVNTIYGALDNDPQKLKEYISDILGFNVDCYAIIDIEVVEKIVDCIGGVYYTVPQDMYYNDPTQDLYIDISAGYQLLNGENAVKVLRFRSGYADADLGRVKTQQEFLMAMASQMLNLGNIPNLSEVLKIIDKYVVTDLSANNMAYFAREFLTMDKSNIKFVTEPGEALYIRGGSYYQIAVDEWINVINEHLSPYTDDISVNNLDILNVAENGEVYSTTGEHIPLYKFYDFNNHQ